MNRKKETYVAFIRGINVGGKAPVNMGELKTHFESMGYERVTTYINSGNVVFQSSPGSAGALEALIEEHLHAVYQFKPKVVVRSFLEMERVVEGIPTSWGKSTKRKYNVLFLKQSIDSTDILQGLNPKKGIEEVMYRPGVLFWSALTSDLAQTSMVKLSSQKIYQEITVRNWNTTQKVFELMKETESLK